MTTNLPTPRRGDIWTRGDYTFEVLADEPLYGAWPVLVTSGTGDRFYRQVDLTEPTNDYCPPRPEIPERWANVYPDGVPITYNTTASADAAAAPSRIWRVPLVPDWDRAVRCNGGEVLG